MLDVLARFILLADFGGEDNECVQWLGKVNKRSGYGHFWLDGTTINAHMASYKLFVSEDLSDELVVEHWCHTLALRTGRCDGGPDCIHRSCVNPSHLEAITQRENSLRASHAPNSGSFQLQEMCKAGLHKMSDTRVVRGSGSRKTSVCRLCKNERNRIWMANNKKLTVVGV